MEMVEGDKIKFDFLGKDSIRYENVVDVDSDVWKNMKDFKAKDKDNKKKKGDDQLFDAMCATVCLWPFSNPTVLCVLVHYPIDLAWQCWFATSQSVCICCSQLVYAGSEV